MAILSGRLLLALFVLLFQVLGCNSQLGPTPLLPPEWPAIFQVDFREVRLSAFEKENP
jgi:hypothetical protein